MCMWEGGEALEGCGQGGGCALSLLFNNVRSARGPGMELLEVEMRTIFSAEIRV